MERKLKPLRPALSASSSGAEQTDRDDNAGVKRKRVQIKVACETCRTKKSACDGQRPICGSCARRGSSCIFRDQPFDTEASPALPTPGSGSYGHETDAKELLTLLVTTSDRQVPELLAHIKSHPTFSAALAAIKDLQIGGQRHALTEPLIPPEQATVEFELMLRHPTLYPSDAPLDSSLDPSRLTTRSTDIRPHGRQPQVSIPIDRRLAETDFSAWTNVSIVYDEAAKAISRYLLLDHGILGLFDKDCFLDSLNSESLDSCSSFMVNSLLSWACLGSYDAAYVLQKSKEFYAEAVNQLETIEQGESLPTLAGLQLLSLHATYTGQGEKATRFLRRAIELGSRMNLVAVNPSSRVPNPKPDHHSKAASHGAWGLFSHSVLHALHCQQPDLGIIPSPCLPPPTFDVTPSHIPDRTTFPYFCRLWKLIHEIIFWNLAGKALHSDSQDRDFAQATMTGLLDIGHDLPVWLARGNGITHPGLILHILLHAGIITLLRPMVARLDYAPLSLDTEIPHDPQAITSASLNQIRRLITICQHNFSDPTSTVFWHTGCLFLANAAVRQTSSGPSRKADFKLSLAGYKQLYPRYPVCLTIVKGLLAMAVSSDLATSSEASEIIGDLPVKQGDSDLLKIPTEACFMIDLDLALTDQEAAHMDVLAQRFDDMVMFEKLTHSESHGDGTPIL